VNIILLLTDVETSDLGKLLLLAGQSQSGEIFKLSAVDILGLSASEVDIPGSVIALSSSGVDGGLPALE
jgi:hypothetical protein